MVTRMTETWFLLLAVWPYAGDFSFIGCGFLLQNEGLSDIQVPLLPWLFWNNYTSKGHFDIEHEEQTEVGVWMSSWCDEVKGASQSHRGHQTLISSEKLQGCRRNLQSNCQIIWELRCKAEQKSKDRVGKPDLGSGPSRAGLPDGPLLPEMIYLCYTWILPSCSHHTA